MTPNLPQQNGNIIQITPVSTAKARYVNSSISSSTEYQLNSQTTFLRAYAVSQDIYLRWGTENCNESTFDEVIPAGQIVDLAVPVNPQGATFTHYNVIERVSGATYIAIEK